MPTVPAAQRAQLQQESTMTGNIIGTSFPTNASREKVNGFSPYSQWLQQLSTRACAHFSTGAILGQLLQESWLVCRAGEYIWNYTRHLFYSSRLRLILEPLSIIAAALKKIGHERYVESDRCLFLAKAVGHFLQ